ncbi:MAG: ABC transporter substrate-binding protein [Methanomassiliicoccales archaeon]|nr:ABC transporter substrate-binding protein [Methanomassiliicoccales archaeon]
MDKKLAIIAVAIVAVVIIAGVALTMNGGGDSDEKVVYWTTIAPNLQKAALSSGTIDGAITWEPFASDAVLSGAAVIYKWSDAIWPDHPCCVVAVDKDYLADNEQIVLRTLKAHIEATKWIIDTVNHPESENYTKLLDMGATFSGRSTDVVDSSLAHIDFTYELTDAFNDWMKIITQKYIDLALIENDTLGDRGYSDLDDFVSEYFNSDLVDDAMSITPSNVILNPSDPVRLGYLVGDLHQFARVVAANDTLWGYGKDLFEVYGVATVTSDGGPYANGGAVMDAFAANLVDIGYLGAPPAILKHLNAAVNTEVIAQVNMVGSAIFVKESITTLDDFNGMTIATPGSSSIQHLMFLDYFTSNGFTVKAK